MTNHWTKQPLERDDLIKRRPRYVVCQIVLLQLRKILLTVRNILELAFVNTKAVVPNVLKVELASAFRMVVAEDALFQDATKAPETTDFVQPMVVEGAATLPIVISLLLVELSSVLLMVEVDVARWIIVTNVRNQERSFVSNMEEGKDAR